MSEGYFDVDTTVLRGIAADLDSAAGDLSSASGAMGGKPDAGQSSDEVAAAITTLVDAVKALGEQVGADSEGLYTTASSYDASDRSSDDLFSGTGGPQLP